MSKSFKASGSQISCNWRKKLQIRNWGGSGDPGMLD